MNFLAKIFVVLVTILSVALVAMTVAFVAKTQNYSNLYRDEVTARQAAQQAAAQAAAEVQTIQGLQDQRFTELRAQVSTLEQQLTQARGEASRLQADLLTANARLSQAQAQISGFSGAINQAVAINEALSRELEQRRTETARLATQTVAMADTIQDLQAQVATLDRTVRQRSEELTQVQSERDSLLQLARENGWDPGRGTSGGGEFDAETQIRGEVTEARRVDQDVFASLNVGSDDGVAENMRFTIHRGDQYIGTLVVTNVLPKSSAGRLTLLGSQQRPPRAGDIAFSGTVR